MSKISNAERALLRQRRKWEDRSPYRLDHPRWGLFQWGNLWSVAWYRRDLVKEAEKSFEENKSSDQKDWHDMFEIHKIMVSLAASGQPPSPLLVRKR